MPYQPVPPGAELFDGTNVNFVSALLNAQATSAGLNSSYQLPMHQPGHRTMTGDFFNSMSRTILALGKTSPLTSPVQLGHRLLTGDLLNKMAKAAGAY